MAERCDNKAVTWLVFFDGYEESTEPADLIRSSRDDAVAAYRKAVKALSDSDRRDYEGGYAAFGWDEDGKLVETDDDPGWDE